MDSGQLLVARYGGKEARYHLTSIQNYPIGRKLCKALNVDQCNVVIDERITLKVTK